MTSFQALYGYSPNHRHYLSNEHPLARKELHDKVKLQQLLKDNLHKAQQKMSTYANKHIQKSEFKVRDRVYLKIHPFRQSLVQVKKNLKLFLKYFGRYTIS